MAGYKRYRKDSEVSYSLGITLTFELIEYQPSQVIRVYVHSSLREGDTREKLLALCRKRQIEVVFSDKIFHVMSQKENCYVIGQFRKYSGALEENRSHIVLVNPSNAGNLGTIMRSALGFGLNQMAIVRPAVDAFDPRVVRASMGAIFSTVFEYFDTFTEYRERFGERELYPFMLDGDLTLPELAPQGIFSLIFGNEAAGLPREFSQVGKSVVIPHSDKIDSLNLPIAASIAMYEAARCRQGGP